LNMLCVDVLIDAMLSLLLRGACASNFNCGLLMRVCPGT
jgi:hypothetical protein